ncbi:carbohydrate ABC transporter permease [Schaalia vaccimaxillae]|uniref:carbohydrate ABC transporter permease n=1 Tax=Schaalia vaccimaxillae TaxID=183916 RepID=UPI000403B686|nr:carbohydrate ABC transporter permease [Schaalia vaccimaxillae]
MALPHQIATTKPRIILVTVLVWMSGLLFALPLIWMFVSSLRTGTEIFSSLYPLSTDLLIPTRITFENYTALLDSPFALSVFNSIVVTATTILLGLMISAAAAFALSAISFKGNKAIFGIVVLSFLIPFDAIAVPLANQFRDWGMANTYTALIVPGLANGFAIFVLRQFFLGIPKELGEAARIDGLGTIGVFWHIYLPLSRSALIGAGFTLFLFQWGAYLWPLLIATDPSMVLGPVALANLNGQFEVNFGKIFAASVLLTTVPMILLLFFQKYFTASLATSGSKG